MSIPTCPIPLQRYPQVLLAHGGGGSLMHQLIEEMFLATFQPDPAWQHDAASLQLKGDRLAFTTDSYVVTPLFFPGGDIGSLAVHGTVNDLAMAGASPRYLSLSFILEAGLPMATLWQVVRSIQAAAEQSQVQIVTGDTKVVDRGKGDGLFINTAGIGTIEHEGDIGPRAIQPGDVVLLSGDIGRHGIAILSARAGLAFETTLLKAIKFKQFFHKLRTAKQLMKTELHDIFLAQQKYLRASTVSSKYRSKYLRVSQDLVQYGVIYFDLSVFLLFKLTA